ncbi:MAG TPA: hypothetical protein VFF27_00115 [Bacteroidia bacterium]|jgi:DNA-directed RNA polymerase subunit RPC12/RpoP|nr:hypothetical protein [Bacteroidia bacterium]
MNTEGNKKGHTDTIRCPECSQKQEAYVAYGWPFATYIHICNRCNYTITESEWDVISNLKDE